MNHLPTDGWLLEALSLKIPYLGSIPRNENRWLVVSQK